MASPTWKAAIDDQSKFARGFQAVLRVLEIRPRPFFNVRHTFISAALTIGCNQKWIAAQTGTSIAMIQEHYGKYIRDDGDALQRAYIEANKPGVCSEKTGTFSASYLGRAMGEPEQESGGDGHG